MRRNGVLLSAEKAAHRALLASIGRGLRERYDDAQPLPDRLAALVKKIDGAKVEAGKLRRLTAL